MKSSPSSLRSARLLPERLQPHWRRGQLPHSSVGLYQAVGVPGILLVDQRPGQTAMVWLPDKCILLTAALPHDWRLVMLQPKHWWGDHLRTACEWLVRAGDSQAPLAIDLYCYEATRQGVGSSEQAMHELARRLPEEYARTRDAQEPAVRLRCASAVQVSAQACPRGELNERGLLIEGGQAGLVKHADFWAMTTQQEELARCVVNPIA